MTDHRKPDPLPPARSSPAESGLRPSSPPLSPASRVEIRPTSPPPTRVEVRPSSHPVGRTPVAPPRPLREEPRRLPAVKPTHMGQLGGETLAKLQAAQASGDARALAQAVEAGVALGIDHELVHEARKKGAKKSSAKFADAIKGARHALTEARSLKSESVIARAIAELRRHIGTASKLDDQRRGKPAIFKLIGTSEAELELLPDLFFTTVTIVPVDYERLCQAQMERDPDFKEKLVIAATATWEHRRVRKRVTGATLVEETIMVSGKQVGVVYLCGRPTTVEPTLQIASGQPIDPPKAKIVLLEDGTCELTLNDGCYLMRRERSRVEDGELIGDDWWLYYPLGSERTYDPTSPRLRTFKQTSEGRTPSGFTSDPPSLGPAVMEAYVAEFLLVFIHEVDSQHFAYAAVLMKGGNVVVYEVPWSDELLVGTAEDPIVEVVRGSIPSTSELSPAAHIAAA